MPRKLLNLEQLDFQTRPTYPYSPGTRGGNMLFIAYQVAWSYLIETRGIDTSKIVVFGRSLGSSIAAWLASLHTPAVLILESSFSSVPSMAQRLYPFLPVKWLATFSYDTREYIGTLACPLLVVHSKNDEIIPYAEGRLVFDAAPADKQFLDIRGGHNDGFIVTGRDYVDGLSTFIDNSLDES